MSFPGVLQMLRKYMVDRMPPSQSLKSPVGQQELALHCIGEADRALHSPGYVSTS